MLGEVSSLFRWTEIIHAILLFDHGVLFKVIVRLFKVLKS